MNIRTMTVAALAAAMAVALVPTAAHAASEEPPAADSRWVDLGVARGEDAPSVAARGARPSAEFDGDDLLARDPGAEAARLRTFLNDGTGTNWALNGTADTPWAFADSIDFAEVDGAPGVDAIAFDADEKTVWLFSNDGSGGATPWTDRSAALTGLGSIDRVAVGDVTGDGRPDLVAREAGVASGTLWIYPHSGDGAAPWGERVWAGFGWNLADRIELADFSGDGFPDILVRDHGGDLWIYPHNTSTTGNPYTIGRSWAGSGWNLAKGFAIGDFDGDRRPDAMLTDEAGDLWLYPNNGGGISLPFGARVSAGSGWSTVGMLSAGDLDGDGQVDLAGILAPAGDLWLYPNNGSLDASPWVARVGAGNGWAFENALALADATGDGRPDLIARDPAAGSGAGAGELWIYPHSGASSGNPWTVERTWAGGGWNLAEQLLAADLTGDGYVDLLALDAEGELWIYPHSTAAGGNPWTVERVLAGSGWSGVAALAVGDPDGDGLQDLLALEAEGVLWVYPTSGEEPFSLDADFGGVEEIAVGRIDDTNLPSLVTRTAGGEVRIHAHGGVADASLWSSSRSAGSSWAFASKLLVGPLVDDIAPPFSVSATAAAASRLANPGDSLASTLQVRLEDGDWVSSSGEPVPLVFTGTLYRTGSPAEDGGARPDDAIALGSVSVTATGAGSYLADTITVSEPGFHSWVWELRVDDQSEAARMSLAADWSSAWGAPGTTTSVRWQPSLELVHDGATGGSTLRVSGLPADHPDFGGNAEWSADAREITLTVAPIGRLGESRSITVSARNGERPVALGPLEAGRYLVAASFAGDDRSASAESAPLELRVSEGPTEPTAPPSEPPAPPVDRAPGSGAGNGALATAGASAGGWLALAVIAALSGAALLLRRSARAAIDRRRPSEGV